MRGNFALCPTRAAASCASDGASSRIDTMAADTVPTIEAERDARALHGAEDGGHRIDPAEIAIGVIIGRTSDFFDFFVYAIASVLVFPKLVFPPLDPPSGTHCSFSTFALHFLPPPV